MKKIFTFIVFAFVALTMNAADITCAAAVEAGNALGDNVTGTTQTYSVVGYVSIAEPWNANHQNQNFYMADDSASTSKAFEAYATTTPTDAGVKRGDKVRVTGYMTKYVSQAGVTQIEIKNGTCEILQAAQDEGPKEIKLYTVSEFIAAYDAGTIIEGDSCKVVGVISKWYSKSSKFDQYHSVSYFITDGEKEFEMYSSYSINGAKFETYEYTNDSTATCIDENGLQLQIGDSVIGIGTAKKYGETYEFGQNCYLVWTNAEGGASIETPDLVFEATDFAGLGKAATQTEPGGEVLLKKQGVTFYCDNAFGTDKYGVRCYKGGNVKISCDSAKIGKIVFELYGTYTGGLDAEVIVNANEWTAENLASQARMTTISIYFGEYEKPAQLTVKANPVYAGFVNVEGDTLTAIPNYGYHFVQWSDSVTDNPRIIELTQDTTFTAEFATNIYSFSVSCDTTFGSVEAENGEYPYLTQLDIIATPNYGYHFMRWSDGSTSRIRRIVLDQDISLMAYFERNNYSIYATYNPQGSIYGTGSFLYLSECEIRAIPNEGYHFVQWSDSVIDNPRTIVLTQDTTFAAEFAIDTTGVCGKDYALTWEYNTTTKTLTISGNGSFDEHMECGAEAKQNVINLIINEGVTAIGVSAFKDCSHLTKLQLPASLKTISEQAFANCMELTSIYNYRERPCIVNSTAFEGVNKFDCTLYVPTGSVDMYKSEGSNWKDFYFIKPFDAEQPQITGYSIAFLGKDGGTIDYGTISFGVPTAPEIEGFLFMRWEILSGNLEDGFKIQAIYEAEDPSTSLTEVSVPGNDAMKLIREGNVYILKGENMYSIQGQKVR